jgi:hypothetical protein
MLVSRDYEVKVGYGSALESCYLMDRPTTSSFHEVLTSVAISDISASNLALLTLQ